MSRKKEKKTDTLQLRIAPSMKELAEQMAVADHRTLSSLVEKLIADHAERQGLLQRSAA